MRLSAALLAVGLVAFAPAQDPPPAQQQQPPPIFRAGVDVVQLEVSILDQNRRPVHGLTKNDIQVFEDRKSQEVVDVQEILLNTEPPPPVWARAVPPDVVTNDLADRRLVAIVMDDRRCCGVPNSPRSSDRWAIDHAIMTAHRLIDELGPRDLATVALTHEQLMPTLRFTNDKDALRAVVKQFAPITESGCMPAPPVPNPERDLIRLMELSPQPVKMMVVLMSLAPIDYSGIPPCPPRSYTIPDIGRRVYPGPRLVETSPVPDPLGLPRIPIYRLNVSGLLVDPSSTRSNGPNLSGGRNFYGTNDLKPAVTDLLDENDAYYLIGFRTSRPTVDGKYRLLDIKVTRPGDYWVRTRVGYLRPSPPPKPGSRADRNPELSRPPPTASGLLPSSDVAMNAAVSVFAAPGGRQAVLVTTVDLTHQVAETPSSTSETLTLRTVAYSSSGDPKYDVSAKTSIPVPPGVGRVSTSFPSKLTVEPDRYELWLTAHDPRTNRIGGVFYNVEVPEFAANAVTVSGIVLGREPTERLPLPSTLAGLVPIVPTASRTFGQGDPIVAFFQLYQGRNTPLAPVALKIRVLDPQGAVKLDVDESLAPERFTTNRTADYRLRLPLDQLTSGRHLLSIEARLADRISPKRDVPFSVR